VAHRPKHQASARASAGEPKGRVRGRPRMDHRDRTTSSRAARKQGEMKLGGSDNHMNPRRARRELWREMGYDPYRQEHRELSPQQSPQNELRTRHPGAKHNTVVEHGGKWYQCQYRPARFEHGVPSDWYVNWVEVPPGTQGPSDKPASNIAESFSRARRRNDTRVK
jgi:hypothetical protein